MRAIAVANIKGGSGKTTLATHIAGWLASQGHDTALIDLDRQQSALGWAERRPDFLPRIRGVDASRELTAPKGVDYAVYDIPAAMRRKELEEVVRAAEVLVVPVLLTTEPRRPRR
jgi:chromosome partitioning protein